MISKLNIVADHLRSAALFHSPKPNKMKNLFTLTTLLISSLVYSQCPSGSVILANQDDIDNFVATYPDCETIDGNLTIGDQALADETPLDLSGLSNLTEVIGTLTLRRMHTFDEELNEIVPASLSGLEGITSVKSLVVSSSFAPNHFASLDPLNSLTGQVDSLFLENLILSNPLPPFENIEGIGYYRHEFVRGIETTPSFPALTYMGDMTVTGQLSETDTLQTIVIPSQLTEIAAAPGSFNWPFGGLFVFTTGGVTEIVGGENLTNLQELVIRDNFSLTDISALDDVTDVTNGLRLISCQPEVFNSLGNLRATETDVPFELTFAEMGECSEQVFESVDFGISSLVPDGVTTSFGLNILADQVNSINFSGNFNALESLRLYSQMATEITGFANLDSIADDLEIRVPEISQLPDFNDLVYIGGNFEMRLNLGGWQLENLSGLESLEVVDGELSLGGPGPSGAEQFASLNGLESLIHVGSLELRNLEVLNDLSSLSNLESAAELTLSDLEGLTTPPVFSALEEFNQITVDATALPSMPLFPAVGSVEGDIEVVDNEFLTTVDGFDNLTLLNGELHVEGNPALTSIALPDDILFGGPLTLNNNPSLEDCGLSASICNLVSQSFISQIMNNGEGCMSLDDVQEICLTSSDNLEGSQDYAVFIRNNDLVIRSSTNMLGMRVDLISVDGKRVFSETLNLSAGENSFQTGSLPGGVYLVSITGEKIAISEKVFFGMP